MSLDTYGRRSNPTWRQLESALAQLEGAASALTFGSGMAAITAVLRVARRARARTLVVPADGYYQVRALCEWNILAPQGVTVVEATLRRDVRRRCRCDADVVLAETPVQPGSRRRRSASAGDDLPHPRRTADRRQHHRHAAGAAAAVAGRRPRGGQRHQGAAGHSDVLAGYVAGSHPELMAAGASANGCWPGRSWARSRRGSCCAASAVSGCASSGSVRTPPRSR